MATKRLPRPRDPIQLGKLMVDIAIGQVVDEVEDEEGKKPTSEANQGPASTKRRKPHGGGDKRRKD